ncbi:MAG: PQQ-dependent sugar dehydrogenase [Gammaproteobacteria bacterium]
MTTKGFPCALLLLALCWRADPAPAATPLHAEAPNAPSQSPAFPGQTRAPEQPSGVSLDVQTVAQGLDEPWGLAFLPSGEMLVTERTGRLRIVSGAGELSAPLAGIPEVDDRNQGGLLDVAIDPDFANNAWVYLSYSEPRSRGSNSTSVLRGRLARDGAARLEGVERIYRQEPAVKATGHFGSRLVFAPDGMLFITQGDRQTGGGRALVQRPDTLIGKIIRIRPDGAVPPDNPFVGREGHRPEAWSTGHRNVQAAAINPASGELWEVEHGTRGGDELNIARKGLNYGWPVIAYGIEYGGAPITGGITEKEGLEQPVYYWDPNIAPSGMLFYTGDLFPAWKGSLFIGGLASTSLVRLALDGNEVAGEERLLQDLAPAAERIRDVEQGPEGAIYLLTDNTRGRILKLVPRQP